MRSSGGFLAWRGLLAFGLVLAGLVAPAIAADHPLRGVALVVGEGRYDNLAALDNPENDARDVGRMLDELGFDVTIVRSAGADKLKDRIQRFIEDAQDADVALVYYSGHGIEVAGENYLVPTDADISTPQTAGERLVPVSAMLDALQKAVPVTIVLLDACRTNSFPPGQLIQLPGTDAALPVTDAGLAATKGPTPLARRADDPKSLGVVIGFAAEPGQPALDGPPGQNSPYAAALLKHIAAGDYSFSDIMTMVTEEVYLKTRARQLPWTNSSLRRVLNFGRTLAAADPDEQLIATGRRALLLNIATAPEATRKYVESVASTEGVPLDALYGMLKVLGVDTSGGAADLEQQLAEGARQLKQFAERLPGAVKQDSELIRLADLADRAQTEGAMDLALTFRQKATERAHELAQSRQQEADQLKADFLEIAAVYAEHAQTAFLNFDIDTASSMFKEAYLTVLPWDRKQAFNYKWSQASALTYLVQEHADRTALQPAIDAYNEAKALVPRETDPGDWGGIQADLALLYQAMGALTNDGPLMEKAIATFQSALEELDAEGEPDLWANAQRNLGLTLQSLGKLNSDSATMLRAIDAFEKTQTVWTKEANPFGWAATEEAICLGYYYVGFNEFSPARFTDGIEACKRAAAAVDPATMGDLWARIQLDLGHAYSGLSQFTADVDAAQNAINAYTNARNFFDKTTAPVEWGRAMGGLAAAQIAFATQRNSVTVLDTGIDTYRQALAVLNRDVFTADYFAIYGNLAYALATRGAATNSEADYREAIAAYRDVLTIFTRDRNAFEWARLSLNLGSALGQIGQLLGDSDALADGIALTSAATEIWTAEAQPKHWADAQVTIALSEALIADLTNEPSRYQLAVDALERALEMEVAIGDPAATATRQYLCRGLSRLNTSATQTHDACAAAEAEARASGDTDSAEEFAGYVAATGIDSAAPANEATNTGSTSKSWTR